MCYIDKKKKDFLAPGIKAVLKKYQVKGSLSLTFNNSTLCLWIKSGKLDFIGAKNKYMKMLVKKGKIDCTDYTEAHEAEFLENGYMSLQIYARGIRDAKSAIEVGYIDVSNFCNDIYEAMRGPVDYDGLPHYTSIDIGRWDRPYILEK